MYLVDTNIFLEVLLARSRKDECKRFLSELRDGRKRAIVTDFTVHSIIMIMGGFKRLEALKVFLQSLAAYKGLHTFFTGLSTEVRAVEHALDKGLDMDDAIQYAAALSANVECIVSYDKHFDGLEIPRKTPETLIQPKH